ncbi:MAG: family 78 glycoside hydrolase catalytic domain [Lachnospiraceae bacterium]|nr:family 78 glycoside hydrolase catalytic domain [Lachnospiraceae bacterium]
MIITNLKVNHLTNPLGYDLTNPVFSFQVARSTGKHLDKAQIRVASSADMEEVLYDSGCRKDISTLAFTPEYRFEGGKRYYWQVSAWAEDGDFGSSEPAWFEGGRKEENWDLPWITASFDQSIHPIFFRDFQLDTQKSVRNARLYILGLGLYEAYLNGEKVGTEYLAPYYNDYRFWVQYQTWDITEQLRAGENYIAIMLGNGWYKGRFCYLNGAANENIYGENFQLSAQLLICYEDETWQSIQTDTDWRCKKAPVVFSNIYDGEVYDGRLLSDREEYPVLSVKPPQGKVTCRMSPPLTIHERFCPVRLIHTPAGEQVLDFGQEITGWVEFDYDGSKGTRIHLAYGEILQEGNFYRENLRTAKAEYTYVSGEQSAHVRPHFTFFGFRYVKVEGISLTEENLARFHFEACAAYSDLEQTGRIETSNAKLNRLIENTKWGQKGNFLDVPTDCPQRDERLGWTGDAQVFCATACYHMDTAAFYRKYLRDCLLEQQINHGAVPYVVPDLLSVVREKMGEHAPDPSDTRWGESGSCAWGDAATVIPWTLYQFYGDKKLLAETYGNMKLWTDYILYIDENYCQGRRLWQAGFHFADWLALDNPDAQSCFGSTDPYYVASVYYYYSASMTAKAAAVLDKPEDAAYYHKIKEEVKAAIQKNYMGEAGAGKLKTQTALVLALYFDLAPEKDRPELTEQLLSMLESSNMHLTTGFVGTAYLNKCLSRAGLNREAYTLLFQEDYPSWLYEVNLGATTIWERWNSLLWDGSISDTGMNSLNHYAYGSICEWIYRDVCGIIPTEEGPGFKKIILAPKPDGRLGWVRAEYRSASGLYRSGWSLDGDQLICEVEIPFDCEAEFVIPEGYELEDKKVLDGRVRLNSGTYRLQMKI